MNLTDEQKAALNVGLATWDGCRRYLRPYDKRVFLCADNPKDWQVVDAPIDVVNSDVPNYLDLLTGLSHINRLEERLTDEEWEDYIIRLKCVCNGMDYHAFQWPALGFDAYALRDIVHASAEQRAIAMAKTLNLNIEGL